MTPLRSFLLAGAALLLIAARPARQQVDYVASPLLANNVAALDVELQFRGDRDGETVLALPDAWAGSEQLWRAIGGLEVEGARSVEGEGAERIIRHRPRARLRVRYRVTSDVPEEPGFDYEKARPIITPAWMFLHGEGVFAIPKGRQKAPASFRWGPLPADWKLASDLDWIQPERHEVGDIVDSVAIAAPDLLFLDRQVGDSLLRIAIRGEWTFDPEALTDTIARIVAAENRYWGDPGRPFLVAMAPLGNVQGRSVSGTGRTDAFSIAATGNFDLAGATRLLAHEYLHIWMAQALGSMPEKNEAVDYWLSEGFTDHLASRILLGAGLWSLDDYVADKNETMLRYGASTARTMSSADIAASFWSDGDVQQISYDRGHLLAAMLDGRLRDVTDARIDLDAILAAQRQAEMAAEAEGKPRLASALLRDVLRTETGFDWTYELDRFATAGEALMLPHNSFGDCAQLVTEQRRVFDRGFDADATREAGGLIVGVARDGPAFAAGMRDGMRLIQREGGKVGDSAVGIAYRVSDGTTEQVLRYRPEGKRMFEIQRMIPAWEGDPEKAARCRILLGAEQ